MTNLRHGVAHAGLLGLALALTIPLSLACSPLRGPSLVVASQSSELIDGEVHLTLRVDRDSLTRATSLTLHARVEDADSVVFLPDDPELEGRSLGTSDWSGAVDGSMDLRAALLATCGTDAMCELGMTIIVEPPTEVASPPTDIALSATIAMSDPDAQFVATARFELEVDGEAPRIGTRR